MHQKRPILVAHPKGTIRHQGQTFRIDTFPPPTNLIPFHIVSLFTCSPVSRTIWQSTKGNSACIFQFYPTYETEGVTLTAEYAHVGYKLRKRKYFAVRFRTVYVRAAVGQQPESRINRRKHQIRTITSELNGSPSLFWHKGRNRNFRPQRPCISSGNSIIFTSCHA